MLFRPQSSFFVNFGLSNGIVVGNVINEYNQRNEIIGTTFINDTEGKVVESFKRYEQGIVFSGGLGFNKVSVLIRCEFGNGVTDVLAIRGGTTRLSFLLNYVLFQ